MKKFLSIFIALAMVLSLFAGVAAPRASAAVGLTIASADAAKATTASAAKRYFTSFPSPLVRNSFPTGTYVYKMGDTIHANVVFDTTEVGGQYVTELMAWNGTDWITQVIDSVTAFQTSAQATGAGNEALKTYPVQIGTGNVSFDGPYYLRVREVDGVVATDDEVITLAAPVYIQYNLTWKTSTIKNCSGFNTIEGWITRGNGQTVLVPVIVGITYPSSYDIAAYYTVAPSSSGQFSLTFPVNPATQIGTYYVFVRDSYADDAAYPAVPAGAGVDVATEAVESPDNDAMIYSSLSNLPANLAITASTYYSPVLLYKGLDDQPLLLQLVDQDGNYVTGADWFIAFGNNTFAPLSDDEVSPGFYHFDFDVPLTAVDVRLYATSTGGITVGEDSNTVIINTRTLGAFNPYVDVDEGYTGLDDITGRYVYDQLPCTIGNTLEISVDSWEPVDPDNWYIYDESYTITGPVRELTDSFDDYGYGDFIIEKAGKIAVSIKTTMWERIVQSDAAPCFDWFAPETEDNDHDGYWHLTGPGSREWMGHFNGDWSENEAGMAENACCHVYEKSFDICEVKSCSLVGVTLESGAQTDATTIQVGKKADLVVNVSGANAPAGLSCGCNTKIVRIYLAQEGDPTTAVTDAFTFDTYAGTTEDATYLWYNGITGSLGMTTPDGSVTFAATTANAIIVDNCEKLVFKGITFNYPTDTDCDYHLVVETFGLQRAFDACGTMTVSYPFISETIDDITVTPAITTLTATSTVYEAGIDPEDILAGVPVIIDITDPGFTDGTAIVWKAKLNGASIYPITMTASAIDTGYRFSFSCAFAEAGDLVITGYEYGDDCLTKEVVTITEKVVMPTFEVKLGLADGSIIANDHTLTMGMVEDIYVVATDPRADGHHDFSTDTTWGLYVEGIANDCGLPTSKVCGTTPVGCTTPSPISVYGLDNPNIEDAAQFDLYFVVGNCAYLLVDTFTLVSPTVTVSPTEVAFTIPASATHLVFTVKDAHAHGAPGVSVTISGTTGSIAAGASGYSFVAGQATTDKNGEADWAFVPPYSGQYKVGIGADTASCFVLPCGWSAFGATKTITAKYMAPVVDTTAPVVTLAAGLDGSTVSSATLNLTGKVTDNVGVTQLFVGFNKVDVLPDGSFMVALKLVAGENTITVVAYDAAGNKGTVTAKVTYTAPVDTTTVLVLTIGADIVSVNGKATSIDAAPEIVASRTFVPMRFIAESFGATVEWLSETQGITITLGDHTVGLQIGNATAVIDGNIVSLPAAPYIKNGRTMVPLRVISEAFGGDVVWDPAARTITITYQP